MLPATREAEAAGIRLEKEISKKNSAEKELVRYRQRAFKFPVRINLKGLEVCFSSNRNRKIQFHFLYIVFLSVAFNVASFMTPAFRIVY